ncbi:MAG: hypothetical protein OXQ84_17545 [bacterium]|nr:hypothetical protein [bacterium]
MDNLNSIINSINAFAWGPPMLGALGVTGVQQKFYITNLYNTTE